MLDQALQHGRGPRSRRRHNSQASNNYLLLLLPHWDREFLSSVAVKTVQTRTPFDSRWVPAKTGDLPGRMGLERVRRRGLIELITYAPSTPRAQKLLARVGDDVRVVPVRTDQEWRRKQVRRNLRYLG